MADNLESKIREMNREILRLKTACPTVSNMITFYGSFTWPEVTSETEIIEITYVAGEQPIMTWIGYASVNPGYVQFGEPSDNKQLMYVTLPTSVTVGNKYTLFSTRQIVSVRKIQ